MKNKGKLTFLILTISFVLFMMLFMRIDSDYLWHFRAGEYMFFNHSILTHDVFSWTVPGNYWVSHEWGFEIMIYALSMIFGKYHVFVYGLFCTLAIFLIIYFVNEDKIQNNKVFGMIWLFCGILLATMMSARPHMLSSIFLIITCYFCLDLFENEDSKKIYFLPLLAIIWTNIHGGSSNLIYLIPIIFVIVGLFKFNFSKIESKRLSFKQIRKYLIIIVISALCLIINPHGIRMITYPYENILDSTMLATISEWQPTVMSDSKHWIYFMFAFFVLCIVIFSRKKIRFIDGALFVFCLVLGLKSIRFWPYIYFLMSLVIFDYIPKKKYDYGVDTIILLMPALLTFVFIYSFDKHIMVDTTDVALSNKFVSIIKEENPERLYNDYDIGGELIYNDIDVFIDGRADLYSKYNYTDNYSLSFLEGEYYSIIDKYDFDYFLVAVEDPVNTYLEENKKKYEEVYSEGDYAFYKKKEV